MQEIESKFSKIDRFHNITSFYYDKVTDRKLGAVYCIFLLLPGALLISRLYALILGIPTLYKIGRDLSVRSYRLIQLINRLPENSNRSDMTRRALRGIAVLALGAVIKTAALVSYVVAPHVFFVIPIHQFLYRWYHIEKVYTDCLLQSSSPSSKDEKQLLFSLLLKCRGRKCSIDFRMARDFYLLDRNGTKKRYTYLFSRIKSFFNETDWLKDKTIRRKVVVALDSVYKAEQLLSGLDLRLSLADQQEHREILNRLVNFIDILSSQENNMRSEPHEINTNITNLINPLIEQLRNSTQSVRSNPVPNLEYSFMNEFSLAVDQLQNICLEKLRIAIKTTKEELLEKNYFTKEDIIEIDPAWYSFQFRASIYQFIINLKIKLNSDKRSIKTIEDFPLLEKYKNEAGCFYNRSVTTSIYRFILGRNGISNLIKKFKLTGITEKEIDLYIKLYFLHGNPDEKKNFFNAYFIYSTFYRGCSEEKKHLLKNALYNCAHEDFFQELDKCIFAINCTLTLEQQEEIKTNLETYRAEKNRKEALMKTALSRAMNSKQKEELNKLVTEFEGNIYRDFHAYFDQLFRPVFHWIGLDRDAFKRAMQV